MRSTVAQPPLGAPLVGEPQAALTVRDLSRFLERNLGTAATGHAEQLEARGWLPGLDDEADAHDAAVLLLSLMAATHPDRAVEAVTVVSHLPLHYIEARSGPIMLPLGAWSIAPEPEWKAAPQNPLDALWFAIEGGGISRLDNAIVEEGGRTVTVRGHHVVNGYFSECRAAYRDATAPDVTGLRRFSEIDGGIISAITQVLRPDLQHPGIEPASVELH